MAYSNVSPNLILDCLITSVTKRVDRDIRLRKHLGVSVVVHLLRINKIPGGARHGLFKFGLLSIVPYIVNNFIYIYRVLLKQSIKETRKHVHSIIFPKRQFHIYNFHNLINILNSLIIVIIEISKKYPRHFPTIYSYLDIILDVYN